MDRFRPAANAPILWSPQRKTLKVLVLMIFPPKTHLLWHQKYFDIHSYSSCKSAFSLHSTEYVEVTPGEQTLMAEWGG
jgi:hypothetical protein